ncbi:MAG: MBL fold metallo-hydrolase [Chloroflexales bacterium]|nr:MBL fold metallo-hydrolase [Chloroflexales bacterium]
MSESNLETNGIEVLLLGSAQDGGVPQAGCYCTTCMGARRDPAQRRMVVSLALIDHAAQASWLIDATPDFPTQLAMLTAHAPACPLAGVLLTHAHIGHYTGLINLGREVMNTQALPVYVTAAMAAFLITNGPWSQLVATSNIALRPLMPGTPTPISAGLTITPVAVPHRAEYSDTMAYLVRGPQRTFFFCPDIDRWDQWDENLVTFLSPVDVALLDGTFYSNTELPGRNMAEIPHPPVTETAKRLAGASCSVGFIHLNHSNPLLRDGPERDWLAARGMWIGSAGMSWFLHR